MGTHGAAPRSIPTSSTIRQRISRRSASLPARRSWSSQEGIPSKNLAEFAAYLKANGPKVTEAHAGVGSVSHTTCTLLHSIIGAKGARVTYRGTGLLSMISSPVRSITVATRSSTRAQIQRQYHRARNRDAVRSPALPNVPTAKESGLRISSLSLERRVRTQDLPADVTGQDRRRARQGARRREYAQAAPRTRQRHPG